MKLIGIIGKSGSGKTTLSNMLQRDNSTAIINLDEITVGFKSKINRKGTKSSTNKMGEEQLIHSGIVLNLADKLKNNRFIDNIYIGILGIFQNIGITREIKRFKKEGKSTIIIDASVLSALPVFKKIDYVIQVEAPFIQREKRIKQRDYMTNKSDIIRRDRHFNNSLRRKRNSNRINKSIINIGSLEDLQKLADEIYCKVVEGKTEKEPSMKEKYGGYKIKSPQIVRKKKSRTEKIKE